MEEEIQAMENDETWSVTSQPLGKRSIDCKWVFKNKYDTDGSISRHKACLAGKGYIQQEDIDFFRHFISYRQISHNKNATCLSRLSKLAITIRCM